MSESLEQVRIRKLKELARLRKIQDTAARKSTTQKFQTPGELAHYLDYRMINTPALDILDRSLQSLTDGSSPTKRLAFSMPPQEGKSQRVSRTWPLYLLLRNPNTRIVIASYEFEVARRWGRAIKNDILAHPELGLSISADSQAAHDWQLEGHDGGVYCVGVGGPLTGRPADIIIIDDPVKGRAEADSEAYRENTYDWWTGTAATRLSPGATVVIVMTRWHEDDLAGRLIREDSDNEWHTINIPAECDVLPDPLNREIGEFMISARGRSVEDWQKKRQEVGSRDWTALYMGRPSPAEGGLFKRHWWQIEPSIRAVPGAGTAMVPLGMNRIITSWDMAFKDTDGSDYVVGQVWGKNGADVWLLDQVRGRWDFPKTCEEVEKLHIKWPDATTHLIEDKANGPAVIAQLRHTIPGIVPITPKDSKQARAAAVSSFIEAGNVHIPSSDIAPWIDQWLEEMASFPLGAHDDQVDAMTQALHRLLVAAGGADEFMTELLSTRRRY